MPRSRRAACQRGGRTLRLAYRANGRRGGFALVTGDPGTGKSVVLRFVVARLSSVRDLQVAVLARPHSHVADFYRELGDLFGVTLSPHNRWAGSRVLRERWRKHTESTLVRPVLIIDEAQEMYPATLNELRFSLQRRPRCPPSAHRRAGRRPAAHRRLFAPRNCSRWARVSACA
ncbi:MAG: ATP-binding protein [Candidatus Binatia bacterium]